VIRLKAFYTLTCRKKTPNRHKVNKSFEGIPVTYRFAFILFLFTVPFLLAGCQTKEYPVDNEQLSEEDRIVIRFSHIVGEHTPKGLAARRFADLMKERSNGFVEVQVFPNGYLYKDGEEIDALLKGDIQMIAPATSKLTGHVPEWQALDLPFAFKNAEQVHEYLDGEVGEVLNRKLKSKGFHPLANWDNGFKQMTNLTRPLIYPNDFSKLRFRIMPSDVVEDQFFQLNASTMSSSFNELYRLLEDKKIVGQENTFSNIASKNIHSLQDYLTVSNHGYLGYTVLVDKKFWSELPKDVRSLIEETMAEVTIWEKKKAQQLNKQSLAEIKNCSCMDIHYLSEEEQRMWEEAFQPVYQNFKNRFGAKYIDHLPKNKVDKAS
jgi:tripartite ATP-independent transporter DctP family solute receptor